ncbi:MAG TPA: DUF1080 domain-containing protein [Xanthobacteraceae bacterium]
MNRRSAVILGLLPMLLLLGSVMHSREASGQNGWITLFDGKNLTNFTVIGNANWKLADGVVEADMGNGFLVTKDSFADFQVRAEFWVNDDANSGIFIRCADPTKVNGQNAYEVNIFDKRPDPSYGTGAIVNVAKVSPMPKAGGKWNTYEITAKGPQFTVVLNGMKTVDGAQDGKLASGHIALQYGVGAPGTGPGIVKFRKLEVLRL